MHLARQWVVFDIIWPTSCINCWMWIECQLSANCCLAFWFITGTSQGRTEDDFAFGRVSSFPRNMSKILFSGKMPKFSESVLWVQLKERLCVLQLCPKYILQICNTLWLLYHIHYVLLGVVVFSFYICCTIFQRETYRAF